MSEQQKPESKPMGWPDAAIALTICLTIVAIVGICMWGAVSLRG
ncbi:hypothetical protein [Verrucosispora sp. TAA-831]